MFKRLHHHFTSQTGALLVELLVVMGLLGLLLPVLISSIILTRQEEAQRIQRHQATLLLRESVEAMRSIRETGWEAVQDSGTYHLVLVDSAWTLEPGSITQNGFTRQIILGDVRRDSEGLIISEGGFIDPSTKSLEVIISWPEPRPQQVSTQAYLTRYLDNLTLIEQAEADFLLGTQYGTTVVNNFGGEVVLASGGDGNWCAPTDHIINEFPLHGSSRIVRATQERLFTGTINDSTNFLQIGITNDEVPQLSLLGQLSGYATQDVHINDEYAYIAVQGAPHDAYIVNLATNQLVGWFKSPYHSGSARGIFVDGNVAFLAIGNRLVTFDVTSKIADRNFLAERQLSGGGYRVKVLNGYAYVAQDGGSAKLRIIQVTNGGSTLTITASLNYPGEPATDLDINQTGTRAYLVTSADATKKGVYIINTENKNESPTKIGEYDAGTLQPQGIRMVTENKLLLGGYGGEEYQVIDISDETNPTRCGGLSVPSGIYGLDGVLFDDGRAFSFIVTRDPGKELKLIKGGSGGNFTYNGMFDSQIYDMTWPTAFNYIIAQINEPTQTNGYFQVAVAEPVNDSCDDANFVFVGPDGTSETFYQDEGAIPFNPDGTGYVNPGRCFRYRVYLDTLDNTSSPVFTQMLVNYSP